MRLFTAIELDDAARAAIGAKQDEVRRALGGASMKWVRPEQMHLTLVFIGEMADDRVQPVVDVMQRDIPQQPFRLVFGGTGVFPPRGAPKVFWLGVVGGAEAAIALQQHVAGQLEPHGVSRDARPFSPHLTLGRWRDARPSDRRRIPPDGGAVVAAVEVAAVTLFQSRLSSSGPAYTALASARLRR
jgi:RNA 2',3'-cyclic 3'-phosphodiesterase